jgi:hypothetical protein
MYIIYNCGYYLTLTLKAPSGKQYFFKRRFVTKIENEKDRKYFLGLTSKEVSWCSKDPKHFPPFMKAEEWCEGLKGRCDSQSPPKKHSPEKYIKLFLLGK